MLNHSLRLGRIHGIEIAVHWSWLIIFVLFTWSLAVFFFPPLYPGWSVATYWIVGAISTVLLFASVLLHELSHSLVAEAQGIPVSSITLFVFGGVSSIQSEPRTARDEFLMAIAGPASSIVIGVACYGLMLILAPVVPETVVAVLLSMAIYNVILGLFNLIPGFPLDGGRVFRSIVWAITGSLWRATAVATTVGQVFAYLFIFAGLFLAIAGSFVSGIWLVFIGWFLNNAAVTSRQQAELELLLRGVRVGSVMTANPPAVLAHTSLADFVEHYVLAQNVRAVPVVSEADGRILGLVTLQEVRAVPRAEWSRTTVDQVMVPANRLKVATRDEPLVEALRDLSAEDLNQLPVVDRGRLVGLLTRSDVIRYLRVREELGQRAA